MRTPHVTARQVQSAGNRLGTGALALLALLGPCQSQAQCQPADASSTNPSQQWNSSSASPEFYDEPQFTVAGVTDTTNLGGHGSDTVVRTKESLAKDTVSLSKEATRNLASLADLERTAQRNPGDYEAARALALAYANAGRYEDSRGKILALLAREDLVRTNQADLHHLLGDVEEKRNRSLEAVREYQRAADLDPGESHLFDWGAELLAHRAAEPATEVFAKGARLFPRSTRMLIGLGVSWHARGAYDRAVQCLCQASDLNPGDPLPYLFLGKMQNSETVQSKEFVERLERFVRLQPENALANYYYAVALSKRANAASDAASSQQQQALLEQAIRLDPKLAVAYVQLGALYGERSDFLKAISAYQQAIAASPQMEEPHYRLAQTYRRIGEKAKAQQELQLYEQLSKKAQEDAERERHEIQQFVFSLRDQSPASPVQQKP